MRSSLITATAALVGSAVAVPWGKGGLWGGKHDPTKCLNWDTANYLATSFQSLIAAFSTTTAETVLADDFTDFSNSILSLIGQPVDVPAFTSKEQFIQGQGAQPPVPLEILAIDAFNCQNVTLRWNAKFGVGPQSVNGITHLTASNSQGQKDTWQISVIYTEFDSLAWWKAIGGTVNPPPPQPSS